MALNPYQQMALEVQMRDLERTLLQIRRLIRETPESSLLIHYQPVSPAACARLETGIDHMQAEITVLVERFQLKLRVEDIGSYIHAEMVGAWSDLHDLRVSRLQGYGAVEPSLNETLEPHIQQLIRLTYEAGLIARGDAPLPSTPQSSGDRGE